MSRRRKNARKKSKSGQLFDLEMFGVPPEHHEKFKADTMEAARKALKQFPQVVGGLKAILRDVYPPHILAAFASYSFRSYVGDRGVESREAHNDVQQYHGEFLQALALSLSPDEWGKQPVTPDKMQEVFDAMPQISGAVFGESVTSVPEGMGEVEMIIRGLQQRIKFHTLGVRNWGYFQHVVENSRKLLAPLDDGFRDTLGFGATDLLDILTAIVREYEDRQNKHFQLLRKIARGKNHRQVLRLYYRHVPDLGGTADELISNLPSSLTKQQALGMVMAHLDLRLAEISTFTTAQVSAISGLDGNTAKLVLDSISLEPGELAQKQVEYFFLGNPVWEKPIIRMGSDVFFTPIPQAALSHINRIVDNLVRVANLEASLQKRRAEFLEEELVQIVSGALPNANIQTNVKWKVGGETFETDLLVVQDRIVLIGEAKSHRLTPEGLRGAPKRVKRHIDDLVISPSVQSARLEKLIEQSKDGDKEASKLVRELGIDTSVVDRVVRFSATLDDLSVLSASETEFKKAGWLPKDHQLAPAILITDLRCITEILGNPLLFYHYLSERYYFQKSFETFGDELDFLGLYLVSGFNLAALKQENIRLASTGMSAPIDRYYESQHAGFNIPKPRAEMGKYFQSVVDRLGQQQPPGWTTVGMHLLSCADPKEQREIDRAIAKVKMVVRKHYRDPGHICSIQIRPPEDRKALVILHFFPRQLQGSLRAIAEQLVAEALDDNMIDECALISQNIDNRKSPYEAAVLVTKIA